MNTALDTYHRLAEDVRDGLGGRPKRLPPKYFYDAAGSELFVRITRLPEYYQTRTEEAILDSNAGAIVEAVRPASLVELGSGSSRKTRVLLDALTDRGLLDTYMPVDVSASILRETEAGLRRDYPDLTIRPVVHDFLEHLEVLPGRSPHLLILLGSTIGNLEPHDADRFLKEVATVLGPDDRFLLGTDLVKERALLEAAYDDSEGVTAEFNRNVLRVLNRQLDAGFDPASFAHRAVWNEEASRIEMHLVSEGAQTVPIRALDMEVHFEAGESILTEISCKYTRAGVEAMLAEAGLQLESWMVDEKGWFALSLSGPAERDG